MLFDFSQVIHYFRLITVVHVEKRDFVHRKDALSVILRKVLIFRNFLCFVVASIQDLQWELSVLLV